MEFVITEPGADPIILEGHFAAPPVEVYQAWTDPDIVMKWFGRVPNSLHSASIDLRLGGAWKFLESHDDEKSVGFEGAYLAIEPARRLVFTWSKVIARATGERDATPHSQVEVTFSARGNGTDVRLVHSGMHDDDIRRGRWMGLCLQHDECVALADRTRFVTRDY